MYGPPPDCKRFEVERRDSPRKCIRHRLLAFHCRQERQEFVKSPSIFLPVAICWQILRLRLPQIWEEKRNMQKFVCGLLVGAVLVPFVALAAAFLGWTPVHATDNPSGWEVFLARKALAASIARQALKLQMSTPV
jgi:hypothetical protein